MDQYIGKMLDNRYEILDVLGTGGMAVVYKARCHRLNRLVAVKILKSELAQDAELRRRFHDESQAVAMLSHPNIVAVYDVSKSDDVEYIVMELIDGVTLKQYMQQRGGKLPWREALHFIIQIVKALGHAHSRGIIHRDIKPHNIMVLRDGSVKVADFGIARFTASQNTLTQEALGSVHYISPEQARGSHIDARSDRYSAGVVLYEMLTGRLPYEGDSPVAVAIQHINSIPLSPRELNPDIPEALEAITMKAMASDPNRRYHDADAMLADLEEFRKNPNINFDYTMESLYSEPEVDEPTQVVPASRILTAEQREQKQRKAEVRRRPEPEEEDEHAGLGKGFYIGAIVAILIFVCGVGYFLINSVMNSIQPVESSDLTVPNVVGIQWDSLQNDAQYQEYRDQFEFQVGGYQTSDNHDEGEILDQTPDSGTTVVDSEKKTTITVTVCSGSSTKQMPQVVGKTPEEARLLLDQLNDEFNLNLKVTTSSEYSDTEEGLVCRTDPLEGFDLQKGDTVTLYISLGKEPKEVAMPSVLGMDQEEAKQMLDGLDILYEIQVQENSNYGPNQICYQSISEGTMIKVGDTVTLYVCPEEEETDDPTGNTPGDDGENTITLRYLAPNPTGDGQLEFSHITVTLDGVTAEDSDFICDGAIKYVEIQGSGKQEMVVVIDNQEVYRGTVDFSSGGTIDLETN